MHYYLSILCSLRGKISFTASSTDDAQIYFKFENAPYPNTDPNFTVPADITVADDLIELDSNLQDYSINIPPMTNLDENNVEQGFRSFLMYFSATEKSATITNIKVHVPDLTASN